MGARTNPPAKRPAFYRRLKSSEKKEYDRSDAIRSVRLQPDPGLGEATNRLVEVLATGRRTSVQRSAQELLGRLVVAIGRAYRRRLPVPRVKVLSRRPASGGGELHGLYTSDEDGRAEIRAWMRTAAERRIVLPRTFLRVLLHELCHHLDLELFGCPRTFHTGGFHARESSLVRALERNGAVLPRRGETVPGKEILRPPRQRERTQDVVPKEQLNLF